MPRRGANIYKRRDGRWEGRIKKESSGMERQRYISVYGKTYGEVKNRMDNIRCSREAENGENNRREKYTLEEAVNTWMEEKRPYWKLTTYTACRCMADKYVFPRAGSILIHCIDEEFMENFLSDIRGDEKESLLSERYLRNICAVILRSLNHMKKKHHFRIEIPENPVPTVKRSRIMVPRDQELAVLEKYLLQNLEDDTCIGILLAFYTGLRIGELCALTWGDICLEEGIVSVRRNLQRVMADDDLKKKTKILMQEPKTCTSVRMIPIPPVILPLLISRKEDDRNFIVKGRKNMWVEPRTLQYRFAKILKECEMEKFNFHMLRHAFATRCIARGFDVKSLSEILGHSNVQTTLNLYVHSDMRRKKQLMENFSSYLCQEYLPIV